MMGKLLKYDFKSMFIIFLPLWGGVLAVSAINQAMFGSTINRVGEVVNVLMFLLYVFLVVAVIGVTGFIIFLRFYRGLLKDEGYLMFTIPVHTWQLILSKLLSALVITVISTLVAVLSMLIIGSYPGMWEELVEIFREAAREVPNFGFRVVLMLAILLAQGMAAISHVYAALALGHLARKHRRGSALLAFIGINLAWSAVNIIIGLMGYQELTFSWISVVGEAAELELNYGFLSSLVSAAEGRGLWINLIMCGVHVAIANYILSRRLNLE